MIGIIPSHLSLDIYSELMVYTSSLYLCMIINTRSPPPSHTLPAVGFLSC